MPVARIMHFLFSFFVSSYNLDISFFLREQEKRKGNPPCQSECHFPPYLSSPGRGSQDFFRKTCISHSEVRWGKNEIFFFLDRKKIFFRPRTRWKFTKSLLKEENVLILEVHNLANLRIERQLVSFFGLVVSLLFHRGRERVGGDSHQSHYVHKCSSFLPLLLLLLLFWPCKCKRPLRRGGKRKK